MITHNLVQGTSEWHAYRAAHDNASDAPAMMGVSIYKTRDQLIAERATGIVPEVDAATQRLFDSGHRFEALARPLAEKIIGEDLYPCTGSQEGSRLSASFDGLTMLEDVAFEHKRMNSRLRDVLSTPGCTGADLPMEYQIQMEQQCAVSGCERVLFMASDWDDQDQLIEEMHCWYTPNLELRAQIIAGWEQFHKDVAAYVPPEAKPAPVVGKTPDNLPALLIQVTGAVTASNLPEFKAHALEVFKGINRTLTTDQDFATAESTVKWCADVESRLAAAKEHALSQTATIDELFRTIDDISAEARRTRLELDKLVKARKEEIRGEIVAGGVSAFREHIAALNVRLGRPYMPTVPADFASAIKGKRTVDSLRGAVNDELARAKIAANEIADRIQLNLTTLRELASEHAFLFADTATIVLKAADDLTTLVKARIAEHEAAKAAQLEAERERIRAEEQERADREARERLAAEESATQASIAQAVQQGELAQPLAADLGNLVTERRAEGVSAIDARQAISAAQASASEADTGETLTLGQLNTLLSPIAISAAGLSDLGFNPCATVKAAKHYPAASVPAICLALIQRLQGVMAEA